MPEYIYDLVEGCAKPLFRSDVENEVIWKSKCNGCGRVDARPIPLVRGFAIGRTRNLMSENRDEYCKLWFGWMCVVPLCFRVFLFVCVVFTNSFGMLAKASDGSALVCLRMWVGWVVLHVCSVFAQQTLCAHDPLLVFPFFSWHTANAAPREDLMTHNYSKNKEENWTEWKWRRYQQTMWIPTASLSPATVCTAQCHSTGMSSFHWNRIPLLFFFLFFFCSSQLLSSSRSFSSPLNGKSILGSKTIRARTYLTN